MADNRTRLMTAPAAPPAALSVVPANFTNAGGLYYLVPAAQQADATAQPPRPMQAVCPLCPPAPLPAPAPRIRILRRPQPAAAAAPAPAPAPAPAVVAPPPPAAAAPAPAVAAPPPPAVAAPAPAPARARALFGRGAAGAAAAAAAARAPTAPPAPRRARVSVVTGVYGTTNGLMKHFDSEHGLAVTVALVPLKVHIVGQAPAAAAADGRWHCNFCTATFVHKCDLVRHAKANHHDAAAATELRAHTSVPLPRVAASVVRQAIAGSYGLDFANDTDPDPTQPRTLRLGGAPIEHAVEFRYLGRVVSSANQNDIAAATARKAVAAGTWARVRPRLARGTFIRRATQIRLFDAIVGAQLAFGAETWTITEATAATFDRFQERALRHLTGHKPFFRDGHVCYPPSHVVYSAAAVPRLSDLLAYSRTRFYGHLQRRHLDDAQFLLDAQIPGLPGLASYPHRHLVDRMRATAAEAGTTEDDIATAGAWRGKCRSWLLGKQAATAAPAPGLQPGGIGET
jgi:hypothetical protein